MPLGRPQGLLRLLYRVPVTFLRTPLRNLFGEHLLLLNHVGRRTGRLRRAVLESIRRDRANDTYYVVSAWGEEADWLRNVRRTPDVTVHVGSRRLEAVARPLPPEEGEIELRDFARRHPAPTRLLLRLVGRRLPTSDAAWRALAEAFVVVALEARETPGGRPL